MKREQWSRRELILAFNLYCKIPFGKIHNRNRDIVELARALGRTPSSLSWKLANFARLDPALRARNIVGASHGSKAEVAIWDEFHGNWERLSYESERLLRGVAGATGEELPAERPLPEGKTRDAIVRVRVNQAFFRAAVLAAYDLQCCITRLRLPELLNASHIVPWSVDRKNRTNPRNGLCLNALHDRAFDAGLLTVTPEYRVRVSPAVSAKHHSRVLRDLLLQYDGTKIMLPHRFHPDPAFLEFHCTNIFRHK